MLIAKYSWVAKCLCMFNFKIANYYLHMWTSFELGGVMSFFHLRSSCLITVQIRNVLLPLFYVRPYPVFQQHNCHFCKFWKFLLNVTYHEIYWIHYLYVLNRVPNFCTGLYLLLFLHFLSFDFTMTSTLPLQRLQRWFIHWGTWLPTPAASSTWSCSPPVARQYHLRGKRRKRFGKASSLFHRPLSSLRTGTTLRMT